MNTKNFTSTSRRSLRIAAMLAAMLMAATTAWADQSGNWSYYTNGTGTECYINGYTGSTTVETLTIPSLIGAAKVKGVSGIDFSQFTDLTTLIFVAGCEIVEMPSVMNCSKLNKIISGTSNDQLPPFLRTIPPNCFRGTAITTLSMSDVTSVGDYAFQGCSLTSISLGSATIGTYAFANISTTCNIQYTGPMSNWNGSKIRYSPNLQIIGTDFENVWFFGWCGGADESSNNDLVWSMDEEKNLTISCFTDKWTDHQDKQVITTHRWTEIDGGTPLTVTLEHVGGIGANAFEGCTKLTSITIPASVTSIGANAFSSCTKLTSVTIEGNPAIGAGAFPAGAAVTMNLAANGPVDGYKWTTFYNDGGNFQADADTKVYKATVSGGSLTLHEVADRIVTAGKAVILKSTGNPVMTKVSSGSSDGYAYGTNDLQGVMAETTTPANCYTLANGSAGVGFYRYTGANVHAGKAYLVYSGAGARSFYGFGDDSATGIETPTLEGAGEGSVQWYSLDGLRLQSEPAKKGVYINNGRKVVVK